MPKSESSDPSETRRCQLSLCLERRLNCPRPLSLRDALLLALSWRAKLKPLTLLRVLQQVSWHAKMWPLELLLLLQVVSCDDAGTMSHPPPHCMTMDSGRWRTFKTVASKSDMSMSEKGSTLNEEEGSSTTVGSVTRGGGLKQGNALMHETRSNNSLAGNLYPCRSP